MVAKSKEKKVAVVGRDKAMVDGILKHLQGVSSLPLDGKAYTPAELVTLIQSRANQVAVVTAAHDVWIKAVVAERELNTKLTPVIRGLRQYVLNAFGSESTVPADFGFVIASKKVLTPDEAVARAAKAKATRAARHTMGKVQKKKVTGTTAAANTAPAPAPTASPAPASPKAS
jgi:hypothetical protein